MLHFFSKVGLSLVFVTQCTNEVVVFSSVKAVERSHFTNGLAAHWGLRRHEEMRFLQLCDCCLVCGLSHGRKCTSSNVELCRKTDFSGERNPSSSSCYDLALYTLGPFHINTRNHGSSSHIITVKGNAIVDYTLLYWKFLLPTKILTKNVTLKLESSLSFKAQKLRFLQMVRGNSILRKDELFQGFETAKIPREFDL